MLTHTSAAAAVPNQAVDAEAGHCIEHPERTKTLHCNTSTYVRAHGSLKNPAMDTQQPQGAGPTSIEPTTRSETTPPIFTLPIELLLTIAGKLANNQDLCKLSHVDRKLREVAQEALVKEVILPKGSACKFLEFLCNDSRGLAQKIRSLDLGDYEAQKKDLYGTVIADDAINIAKPWVYNKIRGLVNSIDIDNTGLCQKIFDAWRMGYSRDVNVYFLLSLLIAVSRNLRNLTIHVRGMPSEWTVNENMFALGPLSFEPAASLLQARLRVLTVPEKHSSCVSFRGLSKLVRMSLPMDALIWPDGRPTTLVKVLPPKLEWLQLRRCNGRLSRWMSMLHRARLAAEVPHLRRLDLFIGSCIRSSLLLIDQGRLVLGAFREDIRWLVQSGIAIGCFDATNKPSGDLLQELEAWSHLSDLEQWCTAAIGKQFSETVARAQNGTPRLRTKVEIRSFLKGDNASTNIRPVCWFTPQVCLDGAPEVTGTFGKQKEDPKLRLACALSAVTWRYILSEVKAKNSKSSVNSTLFYNAKNPRQQDRSSPYDFATFEGSFASPALTAPATTFDTEEWRGVEFFADIKPSHTPHSRSKKKSRTQVVKAAPKSRSPTPQPRRSKK
ncbi:hypothetical protein K458DRAFT_423959 [Lentithecium fluviatile CBS 122367]|uniref:F-box domain-containing protein n=1 Tax=Lentithecium fluviatile CBS 122367 TaxID=1168545 RepID=A0A6G1IHQ9_9PLEO|nr:hypothetical protein K458DRAFT_423959 [Lentithecium fluviatile CBS 122367]